MEQSNFNTDRLHLRHLSLHDAGFIVDLLNTPGWLQFIGNRNIGSEEDAKAYIQKIMDNPNVTYWVVSMKENKVPIGLITLIKRDYLEHHDIGFAFLPQYNGKGYAHEASTAILEAIIKNPKHTRIVAITLRENTSSIALLEKSGLSFEKEIVDNDETLLLYSASTDKLAIDNIAGTFFCIFNNTENKVPDWNLFTSLCIPETMIIKKTGDTEIVYNLDNFIEPRKKLLSDGTLKDFEEHEISANTRIIENIAQRYSQYQKSGYLNGRYFREQGHKFFQFIKTATGWKISSVLWEDEA